MSLPLVLLLYPFRQRTIKAKLEGAWESGVPTAARIQVGPTVRRSTWVEQAMAMFIPAITAFPKLHVL